MLLAIDIGNTNIVVGGIANDQIVFEARIATDPIKTSDQYAAEIKSILALFQTDLKEIDDSIISSVVFDTQLSLSFYLAVVNLSIAIFLYKTAPVPPPRKEEGGKAMELELEAIPTELPNLAVVEEKVADSIEIGDDEEEIVIRGSKV